MQRSYSKIKKRTRDDDALLKFTRKSSRKEFSVSGHVLIRLQLIEVRARDDQERILVHRKPGYDRPGSYCPGLRKIIQSSGGILKSTDDHQLKRIVQGRILDRQGLAVIVLLVVPCKGVLCLGNIYRIDLVHYDHYGMRFFGRISEGRIQGPDIPDQLGGVGL